VYFDGTEYWLVDGFHRVLAAKRCGKVNIEADVQKGTKEDAVWAACSVNQSHGLRRTRDDKHKAAHMALKLRPDMSDGKLAHYVGVSRTFMLKVRHERDSQVVVHDTLPPRREGRDGKSYPAPPPPRKAKQASLAHDPVVSNTKVHDSVGRVIPDDLVTLWERKGEVQEVLTALSQVRSAIRAAQHGRDPLYSEVNYSAALAHLDQAYTAIQVATPYAVCAFCQGHGCKACVNRGLMSKFKWDTIVPEEHKRAIEQAVQEGA